MFSVIVTDYEPSVSRDFFRRKMACLAAQTCDDFEVLVYHDGPKSQSYEEDLAGGPMHPATQFFTTPTRIGDWGHTGRDLGIRAAKGRWIIHTNADNIFYPSLIAVLKDMLTDPQQWAFLTRAKRYPRLVRSFARWLDKHWDTNLQEKPLTKGISPQILIYPVVMRGVIASGASCKRVPEVADRQGTVLAGIPVEHGAIDAMQLVMRRDLWLAEGGWHDRCETSDGMMYPGFARKYRVLAVPQVLGEHW